MNEWTLERVQDLLQHPQRVLREEPTRSALGQRGGLEAMYSWLRTLPLGPDERRLLEALLDQPGESVANYAVRLGIHVTTYHRHMRRLHTTLVDFLNQDTLTPLAPQRLHTLPAIPTSFIGRDGEITAIEALLATGIRLLTLIGIGGAGKTRVGLQVAARLADQFTHGVVFVPLAAVLAPELVAATLLQALGGKEVAGQTVEGSLLDLVRDKHLLLLLDNFEQVSAAAPLVGRLLAQAPRLVLLVTSRSVLHIYGEQTYALPPLPTPNPADLPPLDHVAEYAAVRLFVARASAADPQFSLNASNAAAVAAICYRLDGLPLALELAAARIRMLPPTALLARLNDTPSVLAAGARDLPARQQTLRDLMDWSYHLLSAHEQRVWTRLSVWSGGWTDEAAAATLDLPPDSLELLDALTTLLDHSLIGRDPAHPERWLMLQLVREYAGSRLAESGELATVQRVHAEWLLHMAEIARPELRGAQQEQWLTRLEQEHDNFRAALRWAIDAGAAEIAVRLSGALWLFWWAHSHLSEGRRWLEQALALPAAIAPEDQVRTLNGAGALTWSQGDYAAAVEYFERCLEINAQLADARGMATTRNNLGLVAIKQADYARAVAFFDANLPIFRELDDQYSVAATLSNLGMVARYQGDYARARQLFEQSLVPRRVLANRWAIAASLTNLGVVALHQADFAAAGALYRESLAILAELGEKESIAECLEGLAGVGVGVGDPHTAIRLSSAAAALRSAIGAPLSPTDAAWYEQIIVSARTALDSATFAQAWASGQRLPLADAIKLALG